MIFLYSIDGLPTAVRTTIRSDRGLSVVVAMVSSTKGLGCSICLQPDAVTPQQQTAQEQSQ